ncbi:MAG: hypothetical protein ABI655_00770, partial [Phenylobacterium sp.]
GDNSRGRNKLHNCRVLDTGRARDTRSSRETGICAMAEIKRQKAERRRRVRVRFRDRHEEAIRVVLVGAGVAMVAIMLGKAMLH